MNWLTSIFKKKETPPEKTDIIHRRELVLENMYCGPRSYRSLTIVTYVVKSIDKRGRIDYKIKQDLPLCSDPFYDGDFTTNRTVERYGRSERIIAEEAIDNDKAGINEKAMSYGK